MASHLQQLSFLFIVFLIASGLEVSGSTRVFTIINNCKETIWPGVTPGDYFDNGGLMLKPGQAMVFNVPANWIGRIWGRTGCNFDKNGVGTCQTGNCGHSLKCSKIGKQPATLAEFTLSSTHDFYDVSLVEGFNIPIVLKAVNGKGNCSPAGCDGDLRVNCPSELLVKASGKVVACRSACDVFNIDEYFCRGEYDTPSTCNPTYYTKKFKKVCPAAYTYPFDDPTSIFTCAGTDYIIAFCSTRSDL